MPTDLVPRDFTWGMEFTLPLWSQRPKGWLDKEHRKGHWSFERGFRQNAARDEDRLFGDLTKLLVPGVRVADLVGAATPRFGGFDPAGEKRKGNALFSSALLPSGARVITHIDLWRGSYKETSSRIIAANARQHYALLVIETVGLQGSLASLILEDCPGLNLDGFVTTGRGKAHLLDGIPGLEAQIRNGLWVLCVDDPYDTEAPLSEHDPDCQCPYHVLIDDLNNYPSPGREYDLLMAMWFCKVASERSASIQALQDAMDSEPMADLGTIPAEEFAGNFLMRG